MGSPWTRQAREGVRRLLTSDGPRRLVYLAADKQYIVCNGSRSLALVKPADLPALLDPVPEPQDLAWLRGETP